jgi:hypothetical protein
MIMHNLIFLNPHIDDFLAMPPHFKLFGRRPLQKYGSIFNSARNNNSTIRVVINGHTSCFIPYIIFQKLPQKVRFAIALLEFKFWLTINGLNRYVVLLSDLDIKQDDILFAFSYKCAVGDMSLIFETCSKFNSIIFHLSHYFIRTEEKSKNLSKLKNVVLAGDADISNNYYFKNFFSWYKKPIIVLPFGVSTRFKNSNENRANVCVVTGTFHELKSEYPKSFYQDFINVTGLDCYHPIRKQVFLSQSELKNIITCRTRPFRERKLKILQSLKLDNSQKNYFTFNLVDIYNSHKFAVSGEEESGFPAVGAFEAIACGCILIAQPECFSGLLLKPNEHFIPYDGTLENLRAVLDDCQNKNLSLIATRAQAVIEQHYSAHALSKCWQQSLTNI